jgi:hypothetical protein
MKPSFRILFAVLFALEARAGGDWVKRDSLEKTIALGDPKAAGRITVDNVFGDVRVTAGEGNAVRLRAWRVVRAETEEDLGRGLEAAHLDVTAEGNEVKIVVDGPFRRADGSVRFGDSDAEGYSFIYDIEMEAPKNAAVDLRTIGDGDIVVTGMAGDFKAENVNGAVDLRDVSGSGTAGTLNDRLSVSFARNPDRRCSFRSLNGEMRIAFRPPLSADLRFKTFNGEVYSDFPVTYLPRRGPVETESRKGRRMIKTDSWTSVRIGGGGPSIDLDAFNGDTYILQRD